MCSKCSEGHKRHDLYTQSAKSWPDPDFFYQRISQGGGGGGRTELPREALDPRNPRGPIASRGWSVPEFLRKLIATCVFTAVSGPSVSPTPSGPTVGRSGLSDYLLTVHIIVLILS